MQYGADAVYLGGKDFGMRASPMNFTEEELVRAVDFCHRQGVKVYVTCNILPREEDLAADMPAPHCEYRLRGNPPCHCPWADAAKAAPYDR